MRHFPQLPYHFTLFVNEVGSLSTSGRQILYNLANSGAQHFGMYGFIFFLLSYFYVFVGMSTILASVALLCAIDKTYLIEKLRLSSV